VTTSQYFVTCQCGKELRSAVKEFVCPSCGREIKLLWGAAPVTYTDDTPEAAKAK